MTTWLATWKFNGWRTKSKKLVKNEDLWRALDSATSRHKVKWNWLKGHYGHDGNERYDLLANEAIAKIKKHSHQNNSRRSLLNSYRAMMADNRVTICLETNRHLF